MTWSYRSCVGTETTLQELQESWRTGVPYKILGITSSRWRSRTFLDIFRPVLLSLHPEASKEGEEGQEEATGGVGVWVKEEGESGGRSQTLVLPLSRAAARRQQQHQERYDRMFAGLFQGLFLSFWPACFLKSFPMLTWFPYVQSLFSLICFSFILF